eukprot:2514056-Heterocapsa_arctica.AAC.1
MYNSCGTPLQRIPFRSSDNAERWLLFAGGASWGSDRMPTSSSIVELAPLSDPFTPFSDPLTPLSQMFVCKEM